MKTILQKIIILLLAVSMTTGVIVYFIIVPTANEIKEISQAVYNERLDLEKKYLRGQLLKTTIQDFEQVKDQRQALDSVFIKKNQALEFIQALETIAGNNQVTQSIQLDIDDRNKESTNVVALPLSLALSGTLSQTMHYLQDLERLNIYLVFSSFTISAASQIQQRSEGRVGITLNGTVYQITNTDQ